MKKVIALGLVLISMMGVLASCGGSFECGLCGETKSGRKYKKDIYGMELLCCKDCNEEWNEYEDEINDALNELAYYLEDYADEDLEALISGGYDKYNFKGQLDNVKSDIESKKFRIEDLLY